MRIVMLTQFYWPIRGGEERYVRDLSSELVARGHDVAVVTLQQGKMAAFECDQGVRVYRIGAFMQRVDAAFSDKERRHAPPFPDPVTVRELHDILAHERPDIVHAHNWLVHSFTPLKKWSKVKLVVTLHDCSLVCAKHRFEYQNAVCSGPAPVKCCACATKHYGLARGIPITLANGVWGTIERHAVDMFLPVSGAVAKATGLAKQRFPYRVIPNFIADDLEQVCDDEAALLGQLPENDFLLFVGDMGRGKGEDVLLRAYEGVRKRVPLVLIGRPANDSSRLLSPGVLIMQSWPRAAVLGAWKRCAIGVIPSRSFDSCPTAALEAMAMGRAVVASRIGGLPDIVVNGETGLLVPPGDAVALGEAIEYLLDHPELRTQMGERGRQNVIEFQASTIIPQIEQVYAEVLSRNLL